jgi:hypothetical protein
MEQTASVTHRAIDAVWRIESPKGIAGVARLVLDPVLPRRSRRTLSSSRSPGGAIGEPAASFRISHPKHES